MADIRDRVEEDRGLLKRIQLHIPGFAGYRRREDLRQADSILRLQLANRLKSVREKLESARQVLTDDYQMKTLEPLGQTIFKCQELEGMIRHAEQGYSGFSWAIKFEEPELEKLYEYDLALIDGLTSLDKNAEEMRSSADSAASLVREFSDSLSEIKSTFDRRWNIITKTEVR
ncbi:MAG: hypothetical protein KAI64_04630 [Thermoplasmata archaeon]|nr:hypothetical protein [Thermoplasmata archaeon]